MRKRWELRTKAYTGNPFSEVMAAQFNRNPERFWTKRGAANAVHFYADVLGLPVTLWVRDRRGVVD